MKILKAWWHSSSEILVVFNKDLPGICDLKISGADKIPAFSVSRPPKLLFAKYSSYYIDSGTVYFRLAEENFPNCPKCGNIDYYLCGSFNGWGEAIGDQRWKMRPSSNGEMEISVKLADLGISKRTALFKFAAGDGHWLEPRADAPNIEHDRHGYANLRLNLDRTGAHMLSIKFEDVCGLCDNLKISAPDLGCSVDVEVAQLLLQIYSNAKLGCRLEGGVTKFSIFAPRASSARVLWSLDGKDFAGSIEAVSSDGAVWTATADEDICGAFYVWRVDGKNSTPGTDFDAERNIADPYALAMDSSSGHSIVQYSLPRKHKNFKPPSWHDLVVVEAHLRDVLAKAPAGISAEDRLRFSGLAKWLKSEDCYLRQTGANCVELQPIQEFTAAKFEDYEWGYMPVNWFAPSSSYSSNPKGGSQYADFSALVDAFHSAGIAVILDVVYNHVGEPNYLMRVDKEYYFEMDRYGNLENFSGCGNDFRANVPMARRMIIDSLKHFMSVYGVDGFRFDLAELLGMGVLREIERELKKENPDVILIAEPWSFRGHIASALRETGFASWNDGFREFMLSYAKGGGNFDGFKYFMRGSMGGTSRFPAQSVNYLESHDDMCLFDRISSSFQMPSMADIARYKIAYALVLTAHGIPMLAEGFDLLRTKFGKNNTYKDGAANALDYERGRRFPGLCNWMRNFVEFRKSPEAKALRPGHPVSDGFFKFFAGDMSTAAAVLFNADNSISAPRVFTAFNPTEAFAELPVGGEDSGNFKHIADIDNFDSRGLIVDSCSFAHGVLKLPPLSFGLWISKC